MSALTALVPWPYRVLAVIALAVAIAGFGWVKGASHVQAKWDAAVTAQTVQVAKVEKQQAEATVKVVTKYVDRIKVVREKGDTIIKEVPVYVQADADTVLSGGFRVLHDAAASGEVPDPARAADAAPVTAPDVAATIAANYQACLANSEELRALQEWVRAQQAVTK